MCSNCGEIKRGSELWDRKWYRSLGCAWKTDTELRQVRLPSLTNTNNSEPKPHKIEQMFSLFLLSCTTEATNWLFSFALPPFSDTQGLWIYGLRGGWAQEEEPASSSRACSHPRFWPCWMESCSTQSYYRSVQWTEKSSLWHLRASFSIFRGITFFGQLLNRLCYVQFKQISPSMVLVTVWDPDLYLLWTDYIIHILKIMIVTHCLYMTLLGDFAEVWYNKQEIQMGRLGKFKINSKGYLFSLF